MRHFRKLLVAGLGALSVVTAGSVTVLAHDEHRVLSFSSMTPVTGAAVGAVNNRGLVGGGKAWAITSGTGSVSTKGHVVVNVTGLVIPEIGNTNPITQFKAIVSCIARHHVIVNVSTGLFDANSAGDSTIDDTVALPRHCEHPIVFVTNQGGAWFAMSHRHGDDEDDD